ncbi:hypothetical protein HYT51_02600 [Candidatus Woesearchaeota archaeon]|nr:hypothetical protein [Candidatus Woesearchaeota archaeon]
MVRIFGRAVGIALSVFVIVLFAAIIVNRNASEVEITGGTTIQPTTLSSCLREKSIKVYGSLDSTPSKEQKQLFNEEELKYLYVECGHIGAFAQKCQDLNIKELPTWVINNQFYPGLKTETELRQLANC